MYRRVKLWDEKVFPDKASRSKCNAYIFVQARFERETLQYLFCLLRLMREGLI